MRTVALWRELNTAHQGNHKIDHCSGSAWSPTSSATARQRNILTSKHSPFSQKRAQNVDIKNISERLKSPKARGVVTDLCIRSCWPMCSRDYNCIDNRLWSWRTAAHTGFWHTCSDLKITEQSNRYTHFMTYS